MNANDSTSVAIDKARPPEIGLVWWNTCNFYHFDQTKIADGKNARWPKSQNEYDFKCNKIDKALLALMNSVGRPSVIGLGEITRIAAQELRDRLFPKYGLISLDVKEDKPTLQIALLYANYLSHIKIKEQPPIKVLYSPQKTRPMAVLEISHGLKKLRCIFCHWQSRIAEESVLTRRRIADYLSRYVYDYLAASRHRNVIIMGDLNEEPFGIPWEHLYAHRHRGKSIAKSHKADDDVKRRHLYNCSWRFLGEKFAHDIDTTQEQHSAGTYYWADKKSWHCFDQMIFSGGLLGRKYPYLKESEAAVVSLPEFLEDKLPQKFLWDGIAAKGLSDHLPIYAKIILGESHG